MLALFSKLHSLPCLFKFINPFTMNRQVVNLYKSHCLSFAPVNLVRIIVSLQVYFILVGRYWAEFTDTIISGEFVQWKEGYHSC